MRETCSSDKSDLHGNSGEKISLVRVLKQKKELAEPTSVRSVSDDILCIQKKKKEKDIPLSTSLDSVNQINIKQNRACIYSFSLNSMKRNPADDNSNARIQSVLLFFYRGCVHLPFSVSLYISRHYRLQEVVPGPRQTYFRTECFIPFE